MDIATTKVYLEQELLRHVLSTVKKQGGICREWKGLRSEKLQK
jgi:hypothetical protein